jgi:hypothetical protein
MKASPAVTVLRWQPAAVVDNVVYLTVPRLPDDALYNRQLWHAADGTVVNTIKPPF